MGSVRPARVTALQKSSGSCACWPTLVLGQTISRVSGRGMCGREAGSGPWYLHIREDHAQKTVKGFKDEDNSRKVPLHKDIVGGVRSRS